MRSLSSPHSSDARRAMTFVEMLVVMAVGIVVLGLLLRTFDQTQQLSRREIARNSQRQVATLTLERISAIVASAVPAESLDAAAVIDETFESDQLRVVSWHSADAENVWAHQVSTVAAESATGETRVEFARFDLEGTQDDDETNTARIATDVTFRYASAVSADGVADWQSTVADGEFPSLIEISVSAQAENAEQDPFEISTVIATGVEAGS